MSQSIGLVSVLVKNYDEAIAYYVDVLGFALIEDTPIPKQNKRWVVVAPNSGSGAQILLAQASNDQQAAFIGNQAGGRVFLFLYTDSFERDYAVYLSRGVRFIRGKVQEPYGTVAETYSSSILVFMGFVSWLLLNRPPKWFLLRHIDDKSICARCCMVRRFVFGDTHRLPESHDNGMVIHPRAQRTRPAAGDWPGRLGGR